MSDVYRVTKLNDAQRIIGYNFMDSSILWEALQAPGSRPFAADGRDFSNGNKRLALLGDAVLKTNLLGTWYESDQSIGECPELEICTNTKANILSGGGNNYVTAIGNNNNLAHVGRQHGLDGCVHNHPAAGNMVSNGTMAQTVEALIGAVWLDSNTSLIMVNAVMSTLGLA